jgi:hypothetical protein
MNGKEHKISEPTPEQLLKMLDLGMQNMRSKRVAHSSRNAIRGFSILLILLILGGALAVLMYLLDDLREQRAAERNLESESPAGKVSR